VLKIKKMFLDYLLLFFLLLRKDWYRLITLCAIMFNYGYIVYEKTQILLVGIIF